MAGICARSLYQVARRGLYTSRLRYATPEDFPDPMKVTTGLQKKELLAIQSGNYDPFSMDVQKRGPGTKDQPTLIPSAFDSRLVGCICEEDTFAINWMWLHKGHPKRCGCGHWYQLVYKAPI